MKVRIKRSGSLKAGFTQSFRTVKAGVGLMAGAAHAELSGSVGEQPGHDWRLDRRAATRGAGGNGADVPRRAWGALSTFVLPGPPDVVPNPVPSLPLGDAAQGSSR